ncbi:cytochrome P450 71A1 [Ricinus communis]|uniref:Cytochrome P450, putative n=1 Tax=Ricinus communis TaxID=3988 RepID=B9T0U6_RICCO|nr:cytochrome P450 71A1 [Ricinus communis]EEF30502.1 cytochrome P450, putative [Ricinus communis]|eukprot:XP_002531865.1 cytochrome P450 71A1 [Ricinus communis]
MNPITFLQERWQQQGKTALSNPFFFCSLILISILILSKPKKSSSKLNPPPSPPKLPIIGNLHQLSALPYRSFRTLSKKYGPLMLLHLGQVPTLVVSSMEMAKEITKNHDVTFADRPSLTGVGIVFKGCPDMAFGPYCDHSREAKKLCVLQLLSQRRVQEFHFIREEEVAKIVEKIRSSSINGDAINISDMFMSLAHNILSRSAFGPIYEGENGRYKSIGELARRTMDILSAFCFKDLFPFLGWVDHLTGLIRNLKMTSTELSDFFDRVIQDRQALMNDNEKAENKKYLVDILLQLQKEGLELDLSRDNLKAILMDMFVGGTDTTAATMEWMMAELMKNPRIRKKAQEETRRVVGKKSQITQADINQMRYLRCIMKEIVRFHASAMMPRQTSASVKLQGYDIPAKTRVLINTWAIQRDHNLWDRPEEFLPERFLNSPDDDSGNDEHKQILFSFGTGRRVCPGMSYAYAEVEYALASLLYWFDWELPDGQSGENLDMSEVYTFVIFKKTPLWVVAHPPSP